MAVYIHQLHNWPSFDWSRESILPLLAAVRYRQGRLLGRMENLGFSFQTEVNLDALTMEVIQSSEIEGERLDATQVRSSIARRLGLEIAGLIPADRNVEGVVDMMMDATQQFTGILTAERLCGWQAALFPGGYSGIHKVVTGAWRDNPLTDPMQVVSGPMGREQVHFQAPDSALLPAEMEAFLNWFNMETSLDPVIKAAIAHLWLVTVHPFDDGNGRIARAVTELQLCRADGSNQRFYSMSAQIRKERKQYYAILESTQKGSLDITDWLRWFLECLDGALAATDEQLGTVMRKARFWDDQATTALNDRQRIMLNKLLDGFTGKLTTSKWAKIMKCSADTALRDITDLLEKRILEKEAAGGRSTAYTLKNL